MKRRVKRLLAVFLSATLVFSNGMFANAEEGDIPQVFESTEESVEESVAVENAEDIFGDDLLAAEQVEEAVVEADEVEDNNIMLLSLEDSDPANERDIVFSYLKKGEGNSSYEDYYCDTDRVTVNIVNDADKKLSEVFKGTAVIETTVGQQEITGWRYGDTVIPADATVSKFLEITNDCGGWVQASYDGLYLLQLFFRGETYKDNYTYSSFLPGDTVIDMDCINKIGQESGINKSKIGGKFIEFDVPEDENQYWNNGEMRYTLGLTLKEASKDRGGLSCGYWIYSKFEYEGLGSSIISDVKWSDTTKGAVEFKINSDDEFNVNINVYYMEDGYKHYTGWNYLNIDNERGIHTVDVQSGFEQEKDYFFNLTINKYYREIEASVDLYKYEGTEA